jgi:hypothetical protein
MKLSLSDAVRLGSLLVPEPRAFETTACALGMALLANGITPSGDADQDQQRVLRLYPWIAQGDTCEWCGDWMPYETMIYHPFDQHVITGEISLERLCDWISWMEPPPAMDSEGEAGDPPSSVSAGKLRKALSSANRGGSPASPELRLRCHLRGTVFS